jgi:N-methylhydantoinase A
LERAGVPPAQRRFAYTFQARYKYQSWEIDVAFDDGPLSDGDIPVLAEAFHQMHERIHTIKNEADEVEFTTWTVRAAGLREEVDGSHVWDRTSHRSLLGTRQVFIGAERAFQTLPVHDASALGSGESVNGPAILDSRTTTLLLHAGQRVTIDDQGNCCVERTDSPPRAGSAS